MTDTTADGRPSRIWLKVTAIGCGLVVLAMILTALVIFDKKHFGWMVGGTFLMVLTSAVIVGGIVMVIGAWMLPQRKSWRGITLIVWGLIALTSPAFGLMFLMPLGVLVLTLPVVISALITLFRAT